MSVTVANIRAMVPSLYEENHPTATIQIFIDDAERECFRKFGRHLTEYWTVANTDQRVRDLIFNDIDSLEWIRVNTDDNELTVTTDYAVDTATGQITYVAGVLEYGDIVVEAYIPTAFLDFIKWRTVELMATVGGFFGSGGSLKTLNIENISKRVEGISKDILAVPRVVPVLPHGRTESWLTRP